MNNFESLNATSASATSSQADGVSCHWRDTVGGGGREEEGERKAMCGFEWFVGPLHLVQRVITESWVNHACNHGYVAQ